jgi:hypothetical protein
VLQCRQLYTAIKAAMERAAARGKAALPTRDLGGEFPVQDMTNLQCGLLLVRIDGIQLSFADIKVPTHTPQICTHLPTDIHRIVENQEMQYPRWQYIRIGTIRRRHKILHRTAIFVADGK